MTKGPACIGVSLTVSDVPSIACFYRDLFGFTGANAEVRLGGFRLELHLGGLSGRPIPADSRSNDRWFRHFAIVVRDLTAAYRRLADHRVAFISDGPQKLPSWNKDAAGIEALYFRDPDGHPLELIHFPPDKGKAIWRQPGDELFQGVDHTAIVVSDTDASLSFYRDRLGFATQAASLNHGAEQEALSGVAGARVRVTTLASAGSCGIELLEYLEPRDGRLIPADSRRDDHWRAATLVSGVALEPGSTDADALDDPDGHGVAIR